MHVRFCLNKINISRFTLWELSWVLEALGSQLCCQPADHWPAHSAPNTPPSSGIGDAEWFPLGCLFSAFPLQFPLTALSSEKSCLKDHLPSGIQRLSSPSLSIEALMLLSCSNLPIPPAQHTGANRASFLYHDLLVPWLSNLTCKGCLVLDKAGCQAMHIQSHSKCRQLVLDCSL